MSRDLLIGDGQVNVNVGGNDRWPNGLNLDRLYILTDAEGDEPNKSWG